MSTKPISELMQIVTNGGSLEFEIGGINTDDLVVLVANAKPHSTIIMRGAKTKPTVDLVLISGNAKGTVIFDVD